MRISDLTLYRTKEELVSTELLRVDREVIGQMLYEVKEVWERDREDDKPRLIKREVTGRTFIVDSINMDEGRRQADFEHVVVYSPNDFRAILLRRIDV
jgi:hypothetical protein